MLPPGVGGTFDARDRFAPAAARLWAGAVLSDVGEAIDPGTLTRLDPPVLRTRRGVLEAEVLWVDRFGNVQLAARPTDAEAAGIAAEAVVVTPAIEMEVRRSRSFEAAGGDAPGLITDSNGHLALVCSRRSAATVLEVLPGDLVTLRIADGAPS